MPRIIKATSDKISAISFICTCLVVLIHVPVPSVQLSPGWYLSELFSYGLCLISVPTFFVLSGFFLGRHQDEFGWWKREVFKRIKSLFVPYLSFNLLYYFWTLDLDSLSVATIIRAAIGSPFTYPTLGPLWYVRSLMLYIVISPIFVKCTRGGVIVAFSVSAMFLILNEYVPDNNLFSFFKYTLSIPNIPYFIIGIYLANNSVNQFSQQKCYAMLACSIIILICKVCIESAGVHVPMIWRLIFCPLLMISLWGVIPMIQLPSFITALSFPIYLVHYFTIPIIVECAITTDTFIGFFLSYSIMLFCSALVCTFLRRAIPAPIVKVLFGGR